MNESGSEQPKVAAFVGIDWADQKHDVVLRSVGAPAKPEHQVIKSEINALTDWIAQMHERFGAKGKVLVCLERIRLSNCTVIPSPDSTVRSWRPKRWA